MYMTQLILWWILCIFSIMTITKSAEYMQPVKITINKEAKQCIAIKTNWKTLKQRNKFIITLADCYDPNENGELLMYWLHNQKDGTIRNLIVPDRKLCSEFGSETDSNLHFLRAISTNLDQDYDPKAINEREKRNRNCYDWKSVQLKNIAENAIAPIHFAYQENIPQQYVYPHHGNTAPKDILAPTEFTTNRIPLVRNGIVMVEFKVNPNGGVIFDEAQLKELEARFEEFRFRLRAKLGLRVATGAVLLGAFAFPPAVGAAFSAGVGAAGIVAGSAAGGAVAGAGFGTGVFLDTSRFYNNQAMKKTRDEFRAEKQKKGFTLSDKKR